MSEIFLSLVNAPRAEFEELCLVKSEMASSLEIANSWQSPRFSSTLNFLQTDTERAINDWQSPRISFSLDLSQTDRISPEKQKIEDIADVNYGTDFEFCVNGQNSIIGENLISVPDELFLDGEILPLIHGRVEAQPVPISRHVSLESLTCLSPVRSTSPPSSKITSSCCGNVSSKSLHHKPPNKWKEMMSKLSNKEYVCAEKRRTSSEVVDQSQPSSTKSLWSFSRSCSTIEELKRNSLFRSLPFSRNLSTAECKYKVATSGCSSKERETDLSGLVQGSKPSKACSLSNDVQPEPWYYSELKPRFEAEESKEEKKAKQHTASRGKLGSPGVPASRMRGAVSGQRSTGRVGGNRRLMGRNMERSNSTAAKAASMDSPPPGKPMAEGYFLPKARNSMRGSVRVSPVVNVPVCMVHMGGRWNGGGGLFGFFSKREKKQAQPCAYHQHRSQVFNNRKKGT